MAYTFAACSGCATTKQGPRVYIAEGDDRAQNFACLVREDPKEPGVGSLHCVDLERFLLHLAASQSEGGSEL